MLNANLWKNRTYLYGLGETATADVLAADRDTEGRREGRAEKSRPRDGQSRLVLRASPAHYSVAAETTDATP